MPHLVFNGKQILYKDFGQGQTIVLLHGFTESQKIWDRFVRVLSKEFRVITVDLPGHGKSECIAEVHTMELQAEVVHAFLYLPFPLFCRFTRRQGNQEPDH